MKEAIFVIVKTVRKKFQQYLSETFQGQIDRLNDTYGTTFWSQEYNSFDEIPIPTETITTHNPALRQDWERFRSKVIVDFIDFQAKLIKSIAPKAVVMHDFPRRWTWKTCRLFESGCDPGSGRV